MYKYVFSKKMRLELVIENFMPTNVENSPPVDIQIGEQPATTMSSNGKIDVRSLDY